MNRAGPQNVHTFAIVNNTNFSVYPKTDGQMRGVE